MVLNNKVTDAVYFAYRKSQMEVMETDRLPCIHVSDLIAPCMRKVIYSKIAPEKTMPADHIKSFFVGQAIHKVTNLSTNKKDNEKNLIYDWVNKKGYTLPPKELYERPWDFISGTIDDIVYVDGEPVIVDKKTTGSIDYFHRPDAKANDSHRLQINCYRVLYNKVYNVDVKSGCVMYIPNQVYPENKVKYEPISIAFRLTSPEEVENMMITNARVIKDSMIKKDLPGRTKCFLCDGLCEFGTKCFTDERKKWG